MGASGSIAGGRPDWSSLVAAALALGGRGLGQPVCGIVGPDIHPTCSQDWNGKSLWPSAFIYHSVTSGREARFLEEPSREVPSPQVSISGLVALPASDFAPVRPLSARTWVNSPDGEWTASLGAGEAVLHVGAGSCILAGVSVYSPRSEALALRLNFDDCGPSCRVRHVAVEVPLLRAASGGCAGVLDWMCALMPQGACPSTGSRAKAPAPTLDLACELGMGAGGFPAVRRRVQAVAAGCYEAFDWITPELGSQPWDRGVVLPGASLALNHSAWDFIASKLPVLPVSSGVATPSLAHSTILADSVCVSLGPERGSGGCGAAAVGTGVARSWALGAWGGAPGGDFGAYVASEWWKWLLISVVSSTLSVLFWQSSGQREQAVGPLDEDLDSGRRPRKQREPRFAYSLVPHRPFWE